MSLDPGQLYATKAGLVDCVAARLAAGPGGEVARAGVVPGLEVAWDDCECGLLAVHHVNIWPSRTFPEPDRGGPFTKCDPPWWVVDVRVTVARCVPTGDGDQPPSVEALDAAAALADADIEAMQVGVACCLAGRQHRVTDHLPLGPGGACVGSELAVLVGFGNCPEAC